MSISLNNVNSEVVRAHRRIDDLKSITGWIYLGDLKVNNSTISIPLNAKEVNMIHYDLVGKEYQNGVVTVTSIIPADFNTVINLCFNISSTEISITPKLDYNNRVVKMLNAYDNNYTKVYYR